MYSGHQALWHDGVFKSQRAEAVTYNVEQNIYFLARNNGTGGVSNGLLTGRMYWIKIWGTSDTLIRYFIPCLDHNDEDAPGIYDVVNGKFIKAIGTLTSGTSLTK